MTSTQVNLQLETGLRTQRPDPDKVPGGIFYLAIDTRELFVLVRDPAGIIAPEWELVSGEGGIDVKASVVTATTGPLPAYTVSADFNTLTATVDGALGAVGGFVPVVDDRILVKDEVASENDGIFVVVQEGDINHPWILTRADDALQGELVSGSFVFVEKGTLAATSWILVTPDPITVGVTPQQWNQFFGAGTYTARTPSLTLVGTQFQNTGIEFTPSTTRTFASHPAATNADSFVPLNSTGGAFAQNLPAASSFRPGQSILFIDQKGTAATNPVTLTGVGGDLINGAATLLLNVAFGSVLLESDGAAAWTVIAGSGSTSFLTARSPTLTRSANQFQNTGIEFTEGLTRTAPNIGANPITAAESFVPYDTTAGTFTLTLPDASTFRKGQTILLADVTGANVPNTPTLACTGTQTINGMRKLAIWEPFACLLLVSDGVSAWNILQRVGQATDVVANVATTGSDVTGCGTAAFPMATCTAALARLPNSYTGKCQVVAAAGAYNEAWGGTGSGDGRLNLPVPLTCGGQVPVIVGAFGDAGLGTVPFVVTAVAQLAGGAGVKITCTGGLAADAWRDSFLRIVTGTSNSSIRYLIKSNDATSFTVLINTIGGNDLASIASVVIERPSVTLTATNQPNIYNSFALYGVQIGGASVEVNAGGIVYMEGCRIDETIFVRVGGRLRFGGIGLGSFGTGGPQTAIGTSSDYAGVAFASGGINASGRCLLNGTFGGSPILTLAAGSLGDFTTFDTLNNVSVQSGSELKNGGTTQSRSGPITTATGPASLLGLSKHTFPSSIASTAIILDQGSIATLASVTGGGSTPGTVGVSILNGSTLQNGGGNTVTGGDGDVLIDTTILAWASVASSLTSASLFVGRVSQTTRYRGGTRVDDTSEGISFTADKTVSRYRISATGLVMTLDSADPDGTTYELWNLTKSATPNFSFTPNGGLKVNVSGSYDQATVNINTDFIARTVSKINGAWWIAS